MRKTLIRRALSTCALTTLTLISLPAAQAQDSAQGDGSIASRLDGNILNEIVVTGARRREETVQTTPVAISSINQKLLERSQVTQMVDVGKLVPNLQMTNIAGGGSPEQLSLYLRGFGSGQVDPTQESAIPVLIDGIVISSVIGSNFDLFSAERVEVLRGPQGTLFGKNAPTGVVNVTTIRPNMDGWGGKFQIDYGRFNRIEARALVNIPVIDDVLAFNVNVSKKYMDNWTYNVTTGKMGAGGISNQSIRLGMLFKPTERVDWYVNGTYYADDSPPVVLRSGADTVVAPPFAYPQAICVIAGICSPNPPLSKKYVYASPKDHDEKIRNWNITSNLDIHLDPFTITSVTGYQSRKFDIPGDDAARVGFNWLSNYLNGDIAQFSQELRLSSAKNGFLTFGDRLDWVVGGYFSRNRTDFFDQINLYQNYLDEAFGRPPGTFPEGSMLQSNQKAYQVVKSYALFGHAIFNITDKLNVSLGGRQSWDKKDHTSWTSLQAPVMEYDPDPPYDQPGTRNIAKFKNFSWEAGVQYKLDPMKMAYFRFAEGYRSGGVQTTPPSGSLAAIVPGIYNPETVKTFELGLKADWFGRMLRTNLTLFTSKYTDMQRNLSFFEGGGVQQFIVNAASARVKGIELETVLVPMDNLTLHLNGGYLKTKYLQYDGQLYNGVLPPGTPPYDPALNLDQLFPNAPKWTLNTGFDYSHDIGTAGVATISLTYDYRSRQSLYDVTIPFAMEKGYGLVNGSIRFETADGKYTATLYGHNIFNKYYRTYAVPALGNIFAEGKPGTWGISLGAKL